MIGITDSQNYQDIGTAILQKTGGVTPLLPSEMADAIASIDTGGDTPTPTPTTPSVPVEGRDAEIFVFDSAKYFTTTPFDPTTMKYVRELVMSDYNNSGMWSSFLNSPPISGYALRKVEVHGVQSFNNGWTSTSSDAPYLSTVVLHDATDIMDSMFFEKIPSLSVLALPGQIACSLSSGTIYPTADWSCDVYVPSDLISIYESSWNDGVNDHFIFHDIDSFDDYIEVPTDMTRNGTQWIYFGYGDSNDTTSEKTHVKECALSTTEQTGVTAYANMSNCVLISAMYRSGSFLSGTTRIAFPNATALVYEGDYSAMSSTPNTTVDLGYSVELIGLDTTYSFIECICKANPLDLYLRAPVVVSVRDKYLRDSLYAMSNATIHVPSNLIAAYQADEFWSSREYATFVAI